MMMLKEGSRRAVSGNGRRAAAFAFGIILVAPQCPSDRDEVTLDRTHASMTEHAMGPRLLIYGDSLAEGMGALRMEEDLPGGFRISGSETRHVVGEESSNTAARVMCSDAGRGETMIVITGTNDLIRIGHGIVRDPEDSIARLRTNIMDIIRWAEDRGLTLVLATVPPFASHRSVHNAYLEIPETTLKAVKEHNGWLLALRSASVGVIDLSILRDADDAGGSRMDPRWSEDGLHPNPRAYRLVANALLEELDRLDGGKDK